jgi:hypothetical protein
MGPANTMADRADENRLKMVVLMEINRLALAAALCLVVFLSYVVTVTVLDPSFVERLKDADTIETIFTTMISVILTGTTLVVSIGQLVLTQETGPLGDQRDRMANAMDFRDFTSELTGEPSATNPDEFLGQLVDETVSRSTALRDGLGATDAEVRNTIEKFVEDIQTNAEKVNEQLGDRGFGSFDVISAALNFNYGWKIGRIERLETEYEQQLTDADMDRLEELKTSLSMFGPAREHIKTLYFQWELISLSQMILYAAIPAVIVAGVMATIVGPETVPGTFYGLEAITVLVGAAFSVTLLPFLLFVSYILRILTVAKRTLAIEPLILRS